MDLRRRSPHDRRVPTPFFDSHRHVALIYETEDQSVAATVTFIKQGLERNFLCLYISDERGHGVLTGALAGAGIDARSAANDGRLILAAMSDAFVCRGRFEPTRMIATLDASVTKAVTLGFQGLFVTGEMSWALGGLPGADRLAEYESRCSEFFPAKPAVSLCQYNRLSFDKGTLRKILLTHPWVMIDGRLCHNFYNVPYGQSLDLPLDLDRVLQDIVIRDAAERAVAGTAIAIEGGGADEVQLEGASRLAKIYSELLLFKSNTLAAAEKRSSGGLRSGKRAIDDAVLLRLRAELSAIQHRLDFWQDSVRTLAGLDYDQDTRRVRYGKRSVRLSRRESQLVTALISQNGRPVAARELLWRAWGGSHLAEAQVRTYISELRKKLAGLEMPADLVNEPGVGYSLRFDAKQPPSARTSLGGATGSHVKSTRHATPRHSASGHLEHKSRSLKKGVKRDEHEKRRDGVRARRSKG